MTTTSIRVLSLLGRLALLGFTDNLLVIAGDSNEQVLFTINARYKRCSFVFWTGDVEERVLVSLALSGMPVGEQDGMIIAIKELVGAAAAVCLTAVVVNDNQNACH